MKYRTGRPKISAGVVREVRQRCGFGCVMCGHPIYDIDHIDNWSSTFKHDKNRLTLLCSNHHAEKTRGRLSKKIIEEYNNNPYNVDASRNNGGLTSGYLFQFESGMPNVVCAGNTFVFPQNAPNIMIPILMHGVPVLAFSMQDGHMLFSANFFQEDGTPALIIRNNLLMASVQNWDVEVVGTRIIIREAKGKILVELDVTPTREVLIPRGKFSVRGSTVSLSSEGFSTGGVMLQNNLLIANIGVGIGEMKGFPCAVYVHASSPVLPPPLVPPLELA